MLLICLLHTKYRTGYKRVWLSIRIKILTCILGLIRPKNYLIYIVLTILLCTRLREDCYLGIILELLREARP